MRGHRGEQLYQNRCGPLCSSTGPVSCPAAWTGWLHILSGPLPLACLRITAARNPSPLDPGLCHGSSCHGILVSESSLCDKSCEAIDSMACRAHHTCTHPDSASSHGWHASADEARLKAVKAPQDSEAVIRCRVGRTRHAVHRQAGPAAQAAVAPRGPLMLASHHVVGILPALPLHNHVCMSDTTRLYQPQPAPGLAPLPHSVLASKSCKGEAWLLQEGWKWRLDTWLLGCHDRVSPGVNCELQEATGVRQGDACKGSKYPVGFN